MTWLSEPRRASAAIKIKSNTKDRLHFSLSSFHCTYLDIVKCHDVFMLQLLNKKNSRTRRMSRNINSPQAANQVIFTHVFISQGHIMSKLHTQVQCELILWVQRKEKGIKAHAHLQDFDLLAKEDLGLGQVLLVNALDGHLPVRFLRNTHNRTDEETSHIS